MTNKAVLEIVKDLSLWHGDVYKLAMIIVREQREGDAEKADAAGYPELAEEIRAES